MTDVAQINSTVTNIRAKVRRLTASPSPLQLSDDDIDEYINTAYSQDVPADIKASLFKDTVEVYTQPNVDRYALSGTLAANTTQDTYESIREPVYVDGTRIGFYKDRGQFYNAWPRVQTLDTSLLGGDIVQNITAIDISGAPTVEITCGSTAGLIDGDSVTFADILGTTELNGNIYIISTLTDTTFEITQAAPSAYVSGGTWTFNKIRFSLTPGVPVLQNELVIGAPFAAGYRNYEDDGDNTGTGTGKIVLAGTSTSEGTVVYSTGAITLTFSSPPTSGGTISISYYTYGAARPLAVLWWRNEIIIRPVPDKGYRIELEAYKYPTQFSKIGQTPSVKQWWQWIALLSSIKVLEDRQDIEGIQNLVPLADRQERLIRNSMANEQIGQRNTTIYEGSEQRVHFPFGGSV